MTASSVWAQTGSADLTTSRTNTLYEDAEGLLSGGASPTMFVGMTNQPLRRRAVLWFDLGSASIPEGATVTSASLTLHVSRTVSSTEPVSVHRVLSDWGSGNSDPFGGGGAGASASPGDATWLFTFYDPDLPAGGDERWQAPGGDFVPEPSAERLVGGIGFYTWTSPTLASDVQAWLNGSTANFGWLLLGNEDAPLTARRFDTHLHNNAAVRPRLHIEYLIPTPAAGASMLLLYGIGRTRRQRA